VEVAEDAGGPLTRISVMLIADLVDPLLRTVYYYHL
jgi:hypothetical protein